LRQILINLVSNAIKFTESGRVEIVARFVESLLQIEVIDTGIGIAPDHQDVLFQPFTQADPTSTRQYGGTGLGLSITRRLVEMLGGSISFESELGKGSTFRVRIPAGTTRNMSKATHLEPRVGASFDEVWLRNRRVLVVDDRQEFRHLLSKYIKDAGGRPDAAADGKAAIKAIEAAAVTDPYDAMILDIHMPGMDGYEVARTVRAKGFQMAIIALTAGAMVGDREKCLRAGCDDYLTKPIDRRKLARLVDQHAKKAGRGVKANGGKLRILLVDDSHNACKFLSAFLEKRGHEVRSAYDGASALSLAAEFRPDLILLDIRLPDMSGYDLMERLKALGSFNGARFIALSGYRDIDAPGPVKFDHFLEKPLDTVQLETLLQSLAN
jgi:CheY-like chemotaxis protein